MRVIKQWHYKGLVRGLRLTGEEQEVISVGDDRQLLRDAQRVLGLTHAPRFDGAGTQLELRSPIRSG